MTFANQSASIEWKPFEGDDNPFGPDILHRLLDQTEEAAVGMLTAPWYLGKSVFADVKNVFDGKPGDFATDDLIADIAKTTWRDMKKRWTPLVKGDLPGFWNAMEDDPLGFALDVATLATGGGAAAAKGGQIAAKTGQAGRLTRAAGLTKTNRHIDDVARASVSKRDAPLQVEPKKPDFDELLAGSSTTNKQPDFDALVARHEKEASRTRQVDWNPADEGVGDFDALLAAVDRKPSASLDDLFATAETPIPSIDLAGRASRVDVSHLRDPDITKQRALHTENVSLRRGVVDVNGSIWDGPVAHLKMGNERVAIPLSNNPVIRARQMVAVRFGNRFENAPILGANKRAARIKRKEDRRLLDREYLLATAHAEAALRNLDGASLSALAIMPWREGRVSREAALAHYTDLLENAKSNSAKAWERATNDAAKEKAARAADLRVAQIRERLAAINDDAIWNAADPATMSDALRAAADELVNVSKETTRQIWERAGGKTRNGQRIDFDDYWALQRSREARRIRRGKGLDELDMLDSDDFDVTAAELAEQWKDLKYSYVRPHMQPKEFAKYGRSEIKATSGGMTAKPLSRAQRNDFTLFDDAMDIFDPRVTLEAARQVAQYNSTMRRMNLLTDAGQSFRTAAEVPDGWKILSRSGTLDEDLARVQRWLDEDAVVMFGKEQPLAETVGVVQRFREAVSDGIFAAPKPVADELLAEFKKANEFIVKYDKATNVWRNATLRLRPVWITGNLVGQMGLLLATHGMIKGGAAYMQAVRMGTNGSLLRKIAPDVESAGLVHDALQELGRNNGESLVSVAARKAMGQKGAAARHGIAKAWSSTDTIMQFNAWLTDDIPRRAAFLAEIKGPVRRIQKETGLSFEEAALQWLDPVKNPKVVDEIAAKVTADLVDFRSLTEFEKKYLRRLMPFWSWIRGATGRTWRMAMDEPWKVWAGVNSAEWGIEQNEEQFGDLPDFLSGMLAVGESGDGQQRIIAPQSINPFATFGDVAGIIKSATVGDVQVGGSNPMSTANPFLKSLIEAFTNRDLFYGTPLDYGASGEESGLVPPGYVGRLGERLVSSFPQQRTVERLLSVGDQGTSTMYENSPLDVLLSYFALPTKQLNIEQANQRARAQGEGSQYSVI